MKGISDIIAVLLMLIITIGLAGLAYSYISGVFTSRTAVKISLDPDASSCNSSHFTFYVRNDGTTKSGKITITAAAPGGVSALSGECSIPNGIEGMSSDFTVCRRASGTREGIYTVTISTSGSASTTTFYCGVPSS